MKKVYLMVMSVLISACSAVTTFEVRSLDSEIEVYEGKQVVIKQDEVLETSLSYEFYDDIGFVFFLYVKNLSDDYITLDPEKMFFENVVETDSQLTAVNSFHIINPEYELENLDKATENVKGEKDINKTLCCISTGANIIGIFISDNDKEGKIGAVFDDLEEYGMREEELEEELEIIHQRKMYWRNEVFRRKTLAPDEDYGGLIYLPMEAVSERFRINIKNEFSIHRYNYEKITVTN
ncbi:MAG: hypothetical protein K9J12_15100 [Melioribacteraceae bacterium]|nr:hypothetical protein [Melioribacteraceae bacterium]MCF8264740.1 hypothetical protein [Melioribacteraceae bacterium]MCF8413312.1 hypothetical protein [Melioribacteraceae bacterium]MCF8432619.1 hypothetical protein [Melioribacteraceae bacterium]